MRILVISDVHANKAALKAVLRAGLPDSDCAVCLGDLVGYGPYPDECIKLVFKHCEVVLAGNHDLAVSGTLDTSTFAGHAKSAVLWTREAISKKSLQKLSQLKPSARYRDLLLSHGAPEDPVWSYILSGEDARYSFSMNDFRCCLFGHSHIPGAFLLKESPQAEIETQYGSTGSIVRYAETGLRSLLNPGSVGFPRDAEDAHSQDSLKHAVARYAILDTDAGIWQFKSAVYDMRPTAEKMVKCALW